MKKLEVNRIRLAPCRKQFSIMSGHRELSSLQRRWLLEDPVERGKRYYWRGLGVVCLVLLLGGSDLLPELPSDVIELADEASEACDVALEAPLESRCSDSMWTVCEEARMFWQNIPPRSDDVEKWSREEMARFLPHSYLCRLAFAAELVEMSAALSDKYGEKIWKVVPGIDWCGDLYCYPSYYPAYVYEEGFWRRIASHEAYPSKDFWRFRVYMSFAVWDYVRDSGIYAMCGITGQCFEANFRYTGYNPISFSTKVVLNSLFEDIARFVMAYDIWPIIGTAGLDRVIPNQFWAGGLDRDFRSSYRSIEQAPWFVSGADSEEVLLCQRALVAARVGQVGWEGDIDRCRSDAASCDGDLTSIRQYCESLAVLAEMERMWQLLPGVCAATQDLGTVDDECRRVALKICGVDVEEREGLDRFLKRRFYDIHNSACAIARPLEVHLGIEERVNNDRIHRTYYIL